MTTAARKTTEMKRGSGAPAAFNAAHWRAVDAVIHACSHDDAPALLAVSPGLGGECVVAAAEALLVADQAPADESARGAGAPSPLWARPSAAGPASILTSIAAACGARAEFSDLEEGVEELRREAAERGARGGGIAVILIWPQDAPARRTAVRILDRLGAPEDAAGGAALRLTLVAPPEACAAIAALSSGGLGKPEALTRLRPHGFDEVAALLRRLTRERATGGGNAAALLVEREAVEAAHAATGGSPALLGRLGSALDLERGATLEAVTRAIADSGLEEEREASAMRAAAADAARDAPVPPSDGFEETRAVETSAQDGDEPPVETAVAAETLQTQSELATEIVSAPSTSAAAERRARRGLRRRAGARRGAAVVTVAATLVGLLVVSIAVVDGEPADPVARSGEEEGRTVAFWAADGALTLAGAAADALSTPELGALGRVFDRTATDAYRARAELRRQSGPESDVAPAERSARLATLLDEAERRAAAGRFTGPAGGSAYDILLEAERLAPEDPRVAAAFAALTRRYEGEAADALARSDFDAFYRAQWTIDAIRARRPL